MANQSLLGGGSNWNSPDYFRLLDEANNNNANNINSNNISVNGNNGSINDTITGGGNGVNQSFQYQMDFNRSNSARPSYETGSNFMLLLEDFGEYFYNYNGTGLIGSNSTGYEFQTNCSISNSSCTEIGSCEYLLSFYLTYYKSIVSYPILLKIISNYTIPKFCYYINYFVVWIFICIFN